MNIVSRTILWILLALMLLIQSCREHEIVFPLNEEELITTVTLTFAKTDGLGSPTDEKFIFSWRDEDGSGDPVIDEIVLNAHSTYTLSIEILDESKTPAGDITSEIREESAEHQFFFAVEGPEMSISYDDVDGEGKPLGLESLVVADDASSGSLTVILRHEPEKNASGVIDGDITNAGGDTDIEAKFPLRIIE